VDWIEGKCASPYSPSGRARRSSCPSLSRGASPSRAQSRQRSNSVCAETVAEAAARSPARASCTSPARASYASPTRASYASPTRASCYASTTRASYASPTRSRQNSGRLMDYMLETTRTALVPETEPEACQCNPTRRRVRSYQSGFRLIKSCLYCHRRVLECFVEPPSKDHTKPKALISVPERHTNERREKPAAETEAPEGMIITNASVVTMGTIEEPARTMPDALNCT